MLENESLDPLAAKQQAQKDAAEGWYQVMELENKRRAEVANGTKGRLLTQHKGPNTEPTPGADYKDQSGDALKKPLGETHAHAIKQWQAGKGVVGPTGQEGNLFFRVFNNPTSPSYEQNQQFGYQHDMQATDAELQAKTPEQKKAYEDANYESAKQGFWVLTRTGDLKKSLKRTQKIFYKAGFVVRESY